jgi:soluble lytic murein transglycosylase-like protein
MQDWVMRLPLNLIAAVANDFKINPDLIAAIVKVESGGNSLKCRFEPAFQYVHEVEKNAALMGITKETEKIQQMTSWGLMQVMGGTARFIGFNQDLTRLCRPMESLKVGCQFLKILINRHQVVEDAIASYNAGSPIKGADGKYANQSYVDKVNECLTYLTKL